MERKQLFNTRLDENVIIIMLAVSVLAAIILAFRVKNFEPCGSFEIRSKVQGYTGEPMPFETTVRGYKSLLWDFGDKKNVESGKTSTDHIYVEEGKYIVSVLVNNSCREYTTVIISKPPPVYNPQLIPAFSYLPDKVQAGKRVTFKDSTKGAYRWEWYFDLNASSKVDDTSQTPSHIYKISGSKRVLLRINHNPNWVGTVDILVDDPVQKPPENNSNATKGPYRGPINNQPTFDPLPDQENPKTESPPVQPIGTDVTPEQLEADLRSVAKHMPGYTLDYFYKYTCNVPNIAVNLNGTTITFEDFYNRLNSLESADKLRLKVSNIFRSGTTKCIQTLGIDCYRKTFLGKKLL